MKNIRLICVLSLLLAIKIANGQNPSGRIPDSLNQVLKNTSSDTGRISVLQKLGNYYLFKHGVFAREVYHRNIPDVTPADRAKALNLFNEALDLSRKLKSKEWQNSTSEFIAIYYFETNDPTKGSDILLQLIKYYHNGGSKNREANLWIKLASLVGTHFPYEYYFNCYVKANNLFKETSNESDELYTFNKIAYLNLNDGKVDLAEEQLQELLCRQKKLKYKNLFPIYNLLADANKLQGNPNKELFYQLEMVKNLETSDFTGPSDIYYHKIAVTYYELSQFDNSLFYLRKSMAKGKGQLYPNLVVYNKILISRKEERAALKMLQKTIKESPPKSEDMDFVNEAYGDIYLALKQYLNAKSYYLKRFRPPIFTKNEYRNIREYQLNWAFMNYYELLANLYITSGQFQKAAANLKMIPVINHGKISPLILANLHLMNFKIDSASGNYVKAIQHYQNYKNLNDSLFNVAKINQVNEIDIKYKTVQNQQSIKLLQTQDKTQRAEVQKANLQRNMTIGGILLLLITGAIGYRSYRNKQKTNDLISERNQQLQALLTEKEWLLKEVHHRVKNNLHTVMCLLGSQAEYLESEAFEAIENSRHRIYAMSLIHQKLYQSEDIKTIDMAIFLPEFISYLEDSFDSSKQITFQLDLKPIKLNVSQAIPLALIINEAVTNSIKYAFPENRKGLIKLEIIRLGNEVMLTIVDNGIGIDQEIVNGPLDSLGLKLIFGLSDDIHAKIKLLNREGTEITVVFDPQPVAEIVKKTPVRLD